MDEKKRSCKVSPLTASRSFVGKSTSRSMEKQKDALIEQLLGAEKAGGATADEGKLPTPTHLMEMVMRMQQDQRAWLEAQQKRQEEIMEMNQRAQKELLDAVLIASRASEESAPIVTPGSSRERESNLLGLLCKNFPRRTILKATLICLRGWLDSKDGQRRPGRHSWQGYSREKP
jgi:hypothetical protein